MANTEKWEEHFISHQESLIGFYEPIVGSREAARVLVERCRNLRHDRTPLRIMNSIERLISLSEDVAALRPEHPALSVFFLVVCVESILALAEVSHHSKAEGLVDFFDRFLSPNDQAALKAHFHRHKSDSRWKESGHELSIENIARLVNELRNLFAHEGDYWSFNFSDDSHNSYVTRIELKEYAEDNKKEHSYAVSLTLTEFRDIILRGCVSLLEEALNNAEKD